MDDLAISSNKKADVQVDSALKIDDQPIKRAKELSPEAKGKLRRFK